MNKEMSPCCLYSQASPAEGLTPMPMRDFTQTCDAAETPGPFCSPCRIQSPLPISLPAAKAQYHQGGGDPVSPTRWPEPPGPTCCCPRHHSDHPTPRGPWSPLRWPREGSRARQWLA